MTGRFRDLTERRVPQYLAIYIGVCWGLVQFMSFLEDRYPSVVSAVWTDITLLATVLLIPSVALFTYNHGRPGRDRWTVLEKVAIPANLALAAGILFLAFGGRDLRENTAQREQTGRGENLQKTHNLLCKSGLSATKPAP